MPRQPKLCEHGIEPIYCWTCTPNPLAPERGTAFSLADLRRHDVQALGGAISLREWHGVERAYNALRDKIDAALNAIAMEAATAGETPKSGSTRSATARVRKDIAQTQSPNLSQGDTP
jgi:hypothetical protein